MDVSLETSESIELEPLLEAIHLRRRLHRCALTEGAAYDAARFNADLLGNVVLAHHNLATDRAFSDFHLVMCRNVLIYFDTPLQNRVAADERIFRKAA